MRRQSMCARGGHNLGPKKGVYEKGGQKVIHTFTKQRKNKREISRRGLGYSWGGGGGLPEPNLRN